MLCQADSRDPKKHHAREINSGYQDRAKSRLHPNRDADSANNQQHSIQISPESVGRSPFWSNLQPLNKSRIENILNPERRHADRKKDSSEVGQVPDLPSAHYSARASKIHATFSTIPAASPVKAFTRSSNLLNLSSAVCPFQYRK